MVFELFLFFFFRRYPGVERFDWIVHPVTLVGVSYIMFRQVHLVIDAPYSTAPLTPLRYFAYTTAFWTLLAGPIQRYDDFCGGLSHVSAEGGQEVLGPLHRVTTGVLKAFVLAPIFAASSKLVPLTPEDPNWIRWGLGFYSYFIFLYFDFSGYTDIVIGMARLCGFDTLPENFDRPYAARNVQEFWARWHMSLGSWFRDYVYTPLFKIFAERLDLRLYWLANVVALFITFTLVGVWHGPGLNFLTFGLFQALGVSAAALMRVLREQLSDERREWLEESATVSWLARIFCFHYICGSFLLLENSPAEVARYLASISAFGSS